MKGEFDLKPKDLIGHLTPEQKLLRTGLPGGLTPREATAVAKARFHVALNDLMQGNVSKVSGWLDQVAERDPARAIQLLMELTEFVMPRLKAAQVVANLTPTAEGKEALGSMTMEELQRVVAEG
jgi:hypothetical protein